MSAARVVLPVTVPAGERVLDLLPAFADALAGTGPALLPLGHDDPRGPAIARQLSAGEPLAQGEDDPADPTAFVVTTSGSTGLPKGVLVPAGALAASAAATEERLGGPGHWLLALPAQHIAGLQVLLRAVRSSTDPVIMDRDIPFTATDFLIAAERLPGPRRYVSLVPTQLRRVLDDTGAARATAELFDAILVGGAASPPLLLNAARDAGLPVVTTYGMTETCGGCVYDGVPLPGAAARIGLGGTIELTGPMVARGYRLASDPAFATPGTFVTADAGEITLDGRVAVLGRIDDIIVSGGVKVPPAAVEAAVLALPGIKDVCVVGVPDAEWGEAVAALVVTAPTAEAPPWTVQALRSALTGLPASHRPRLLRLVDTIPMLPSGKPDRRTATRLADTASPAR